MNPIKSLVLFSAVFIVGCAAQTSTTQEKLPLSYFIPKAEAEAEQQLIVDEHIYGGIELLGILPAGAVLQPEQSDRYIQRYKLDDVAPFTFALVDVIDEVVVGVMLYYLTDNATDARDIFNASRKKMYGKYSKSDNIAQDRDDMAMWSFLTKAKWVEYRAADMERRYNMAWLFAKQKRINTGIDEILSRASVSMLKPTDTMPFYSVAIAYESHDKRSADANRRKDLEDSLDL